MPLLFTVPEISIKASLRKYDKLMISLTKSFSWKLLFCFFQNGEQIKIFVLYNNYYFKFPFASSNYSYSNAKPKY